uniref:Uncharacterized protein n=1 Tax=Strigamia maritima TaxID=126957 RepID=T1J5M7_STRMM
MESIRSRREVEDVGVLASCDCTSYCYFALAVVLFTVGIVITVLALDEAGGTMLSNLGHMWLVGPIFISSGNDGSRRHLKTKVGSVLIFPKDRLILELQGLQHQQQELERNPSLLTLPPPYDAVVCESNSTERNPNPENCTSQRVEEPPPPSYDEALLLSQRLQRDLIIPPRSVSDYIIGKDSML